MTQQSHRHQRWVSATDTLKRLFAEIPSIWKTIIDVNNDYELTIEKVVSGNLLEARFDFHESVITIKLDCTTQGIKSILRNFFSVPRFDQQQKFGTFEISGFKGTAQQLKHCLETLICDVASCVVNISSGTLYRPSLYALWYRQAGCELPESVKLQHNMIPLVDVYQKYVTLTACDTILSAAECDLLVDVADDDYRMLLIEDYLPAYFMESTMRSEY